MLHVPHRQTCALGLAFAASLAGTAPAHATSSFSAQAYAYFSTGSAATGPVSAGAIDSHVLNGGTATAVTQTDPFTGGHGQVATNGCQFSPVGQDICNSANTNISTGDEITIPPTAAAPLGTPVDVRFDWQVDGSINGYGAWSVTTSLSLNPCFGCIIVLGNASYSDGTGGTMQNAALAIHETRSFTATLAVGTTYALTSRLDLSAGERVIGPPPYAIAVDFYAGGGTIQAFVLTPGTGPLQFLGSSGRDYFQPPSAFADTDLDARRDALDNCTLVANYDQRDTNSDGYGNVCDADFNGDGTVNINDFNRLKARLNISPVVDVDTDLDGNGAVNINDFNRLKSYLGKPPGPSGLHPNCPPTCP
jgi:hypothetical protein